ncbi:hypothetical protein C3V43_13155 [Bacteroides heparinolyticus]|nr:hypothetical protein C3V43_13155 [Bacteroides heparinolyticus]
MLAVFVSRRKDSANLFYYTAISTEYIRSFEDLWWADMRLAEIGYCNIFETFLSNIRHTDLIAVLFFAYKKSIEISVGGIIITHTRSFHEIIISQSRRMKQLNKLIAPDS